MGRSPTQIGPLRKVRIHSENLKIGIRIAAGFAAVIIIAIALGMFAYNKLEGIDQGLGTDRHECTAGGLFYRSGTELHYEKRKKPLF